MKTRILKLSFKKYLTSLVLALLLSHGFFAYDCLSVSAIGENNSGAFTWDQVKTGFDYIVEGVKDAISSGSVSGGLVSFAQAAVYSGCAVAYNEWRDSQTPITISATDCAAVVGYYTNGETNEVKEVLIFGLDGVPQDITSSFAGTTNGVNIENFCISDDFCISAYIRPNDCTWLEGDYIKCTTFNDGNSRTAYGTTFIYSVMNDNDDSRRTFDIIFHNNTTSYLFQGTTNDTILKSSGYGNNYSLAPGFRISTSPLYYVSQYMYNSNAKFNSVVTAMPGSTSLGSFCAVNGVDDASNIAVGKNITGTTHITCPPGNIIQNDYDSYSNYINHDFREYITNNYPDQVTNIIPPSDYYPREDEPDTQPSTDPSYSITYPEMLPLPTFPAMEMPEVDTSVFGQLTAGVGFYFSNFSSLVDAFDLRWLVSIILILTIVIMILSR